MFEIKEFQKEDIGRVITFEHELRRQEPDTYFWDADEAYVEKLEESFEDMRFATALSFLAIENGEVIGRIDASIIASRSDASCSSAYLDWICVLKDRRHQEVGQALLKELRAECKRRGISLLIALMAENAEAQSFYRNVEDASIRDAGIWMEIR